MIKRMQGDAGSSLAEYCLTVTLVSSAALASITTLGQLTKTSLDDSNAKIEQAFECAERPTCR